VLPKNLRTAVKYLSDGELRSSRTDKSSSGRQVEPAPLSLTRGQINAVRAAFKAGIKPRLIARQFGISQSDVRKVLASNAGA
jgi:DNA invertase Pin-like site-specific DNA recombinase